MVGHRPDTLTTWRISLGWNGLERHAPGQHVDVRLTAEDGYQAQRSYSIASGPQAETLDLIVERLADGEVSPYLTDVLMAGDLIEVRGPIGAYFVWDAGHAEPLQLIAGGSGVVPFLAMLDHHEAAVSPVSVRLLYSTRSEETIISAARLDHHRARGVGIDIALTRSQPAGWAGISGRVTRSVLDRSTHPVAARPLVFVCGPTSFVEAVASELVALGHPPTLIRTERFGGTESDERRE